MDREIGRQIKSVRAQISNVFKPGTGLVDLELFPGLKRKKSKAMSYMKLPSTSRDKEKMVLPNISIHRNPMSYVTDREIIRYRPMQRRKSFSKGSLLYKVAVKSSDEHVDWDNVISTCSKLIRARY